MSATPATLTVRDEAASGERSGPLALEFLTERITVRELIRGRIYQEVQDHNTGVRAAAEAPRALVQPSELEEQLNGPRDAAPGRQARRREVDWKKQYEIACDAFDRGGFLVLVDDEQKTELDDEIVIKPGTEVTFLKLMPLVGG